MTIKVTLKSKTILKLITYVFIFFLSLSSYSQLSDLHYLPPLKQGGNNQTIVQHSLYLSTPETVAFDVNIYRGTSAAILATVNSSNAISGQYDLPNT